MGALTSIFWLNKAKNTHIVSCWFLAGEVSLFVRFMSLFVWQS